MEGKADIKELSVAVWRLEKWLSNLETDRKMAAKSALRGIKNYLEALEITIVDPIGGKFDPGLAIEVVNNEAPDETNDDELIIIETLSPYLYQAGELIQHARVIIGVDSKNENDSTNRSQVQEVARASKSVDSDSEKVVINEKDIERMMKYAKNI